MIIHYGADVDDAAELTLFVLFTHSILQNWEKEHLKNFLDILDHNISYTKVFLHP